MFLVIGAPITAVTAHIARPMAATMDTRGFRRAFSGIRLVSAPLTGIWWRSTICAVDICVLGPVTVHGGEALRPRDRLVLGALAVKRGHVLAPAEIADAVWGDTPPPSWPKQVQICVVSLRKALGPNAIETVSGRYRLASPTWSASRRVATLPAFATTPVPSAENDRPVDHDVCFTCEVPSE